MGLLVKKIAAELITSLKIKTVYVQRVHYHGDLLNIEPQFRTIKLEEKCKN